MRRGNEMKVIKSANTTTYICEKDQTILVERHDDGTFSMMSSCQHYVWWELTKASYYLGIGDIPKHELQYLRKNAILILEEGMFVNVLVPSL
jgi:hypothetical protein